MEHLELIVLGLLVAVVGLVLLAHVARVPYPILLVVGGPPVPGAADGDDPEDYEERSADFQRLRRELLEAERTALLHLRSEGKIGEDAMRRVERGYWTSMTSA